MGILAGEASERETGCRVVVDLPFDLQEFGLGSVLWDVSEVAP